MSSSSNAGSSKRRGQYSSRACNGCRRRRCKCDGVQPICGTCSFYGRECEWSSETDARRPVTKQLVESLRVKIQVLEAEVEQLKNNKSLLTPGGSQSQLLDHSTSRATSPAASTGTSNNPVLTVHTPQDIKPILNYGEGMSDVERPPPPPSQFTAKVMYRYIFEIDESIPSNERAEDSQMSLMCDWSRYLPPLGNITLSRHEHDTLLLRCFKYGTSWLLGLIPELFLHDMLYFLGAEESQLHSTPRLQYYTPLLHCSVLAFATAFSDDPVIRVPATRGVFASWAKQWLDEEFKRPTMSLVRSLALIAEYHCGLGEREAGYMYMGMSFRAARALISSEENELWMNEGSVDFPESINRDWHFWSAFAHDKVMALEYKQDYDIPIPHPHVSFPSVDSVLDNQPWPLEAPLGSMINATPPKLLTTTFHESCKLMVIATQVTSTTLRQTQDILEQHSIIINIHLRLDTWFNQLPENLLVWARSTSPLPHVIALHVSYWWLLLVLHRPFYQKDQPSDADTKIPITDLSIKMCDRAAHKIVQLIKMFDEQHGLRFFPRNMVQAISDCGLALLKEFSWAPLAAIKKRANATCGVITCINALRTIAPTWPFAQKYAEELDSRLKEQRIPPAAGGTLNDPSADQEMEDSVDISTMFHQYMTQWGQAPLAQVYGPLQPMQAVPSVSASETSQPNDMLVDSGWEAKGSF